MPQAPVRRPASKSSDIAALVRLHHRRRGWAWVAACSAAGLVVYAGIDSGRSAKLTGAAEILSVTTVFVLAALVLAGLAVITADTLGIRRAETAARLSAKRSVSHYPLYAHAHRYPPRHRGSWVFAIAVLTAMTGITVLLLPTQVNSWAYVTGAESPGIFNPVSYSRACVGGVFRGGGGCHPVTDGYLSRNGADVTWVSVVPLGRPVSVRDPLWTWGRGRNLISGYGTAVANIIACLFFDGATLLLLYVLLIVLRGGPARRGQRVR
jgi:hypothetical protein